MAKLDLKFGGYVSKNKDGSVVPADQWMVFLAKDNAVPATLQAYLVECIRLGAGQAQIDGVRGLIARVDRWRTEHPEVCKVPDVEPLELNEALL